MSFIRSRKYIPWVVLAVGLTLLVLTSWPLPTNRFEWTAADKTRRYTFILDWPAAVRVGENRQAVLTVSPNFLPDAAAESAKVLETRLEFANVQIDPNGSIRQPVSSSSLAFHWSIGSLQAGTPEGTLWIYTVMPGDDGGEMQTALTARPLEFRSFGHSLLPLGLFRAAGLIFVAVGLLLLGSSVKK